jgi:hypothetical protein
MRRVVAALERRGFALKRARALEYFAREGDWQAVAYAASVACLEAWEIDPSREAGLRTNLPGAVVRILDSIQAARLPEHRARFDLVVIDNPQGCFGPEGRYCEHFDALETVGGLLDGGGVVVFNVNRAPFDFDRQDAWRARRAAFYGLTDTSRLSARFLLDFYRGYFGERGFESVFAFVEPRNAEYLSYLVFRLDARAGGEPA